MTLSGHSLGRLDEESIRSLPTDAVALLGNSTSNGWAQLSADIPYNPSIDLTVSILPSSE